MTDIVAYQGRANLLTLQLLADGLPPDVIERVTLSIPGPAFVDGQLQEVEAVLGPDPSFQLGLLPGLQVGEYITKLTVYDPTNPQGVAWQAMLLRVVPWETEA